MVLKTKIFTLIKVQNYLPNYPKVQFHDLQIYPFLMLYGFFSFPLFFTLHSFALVVIFKVTLFIYPLLLFASKSISIFLIQVTFVLFIHSLALYNSLWNNIRLWFLSLLKFPLNYYLIFKYQSL